MVLGASSLHREEVGDEGPGQLINIVKSMSCTLRYVCNTCMLMTEVTEAMELFEAK